MFVNYPTLTTERLVLRPLTTDDAADLFCVFGDDEVMRYWVSFPHASVERTREEIERITSPAKAMQWAICLKDDLRAAGVIGFLGNEGVPGIGYILRRDLWRCGFGTEALSAVVGHGFEALGYERVELWIHEDNIASQKLANKVGFKPMSRFHMKWEQFDAPHAMIVYGLEHDLSSRSTRAIFDRVEPILEVPDVRAAAEYYRDKLGFTIEFLYGMPPTHAGIARGDWTFPAARLQLTQGEPAPARLFFFIGNNIDLLEAEYRSKGVQFESSLENKPWRMREFAIRDLNGCILRFGMPS
jgi:RimJ/RimL family protein N-acetyltransferase/catechol 2,3-dioxygenase-like lactoylglutathione lyase family enzyme